MTVGQDCYPWTLPQKYSLQQDLWHPGETSWRQNRNRTHENVENLIKNQKPEGFFFMQWLRVCVRVGGRIWLCYPTKISVVLPNQNPMFATCSFLGGVATTWFWLTRSLHLAKFHHRTGEGVKKWRVEVNTLPLHAGEVELNVFALSQKYKWCRSMRGAIFCFFFFTNFVLAWIIFQFISSVLHF